MSNVTPHSLITEYVLVNQPATDTNLASATLAVIAIASLIFAIRGFGRALEPLVQMVRLAVNLTITTLMATAAIAALAVTMVVMIR